MSLKWSAGIELIQQQQIFASIMNRDDAQYGVNPANHAPAELVQEARSLAKRLHRPVYLFQAAEGWGVARQLSQIPAGALITEVRAGSIASELWNTGGC